MAIDFFSGDETEPHFTITEEELSEIVTKFHKLGLIETMFDTSIQQQCLKITHKGLKYLIALQGLIGGEIVYEKH